MVTIAGGIILAVVLLACWPIVLAAGFFLLLGALGLGAIALIVSNEEARGLCLVLGAIVLGFWLAGRVLDLAADRVRRVRALGTVREVLILTALSMRPAFSDRQRIHKESMLIRYRAGMAARMADRLRRAEARAATCAETARHRAESWKAKRAVRARASLARRARKLERHLGRYGLFTFRYGEEGVEIASTASAGEPIVMTVGYEPDHWAMFYRLARGQGETSVYTQPHDMMVEVRKILRRHAAEWLAAQSRQSA